METTILLLATNSSERNRSSFPSFYAFLRITGRKLRSLLRALCIEVFDRRNFGVTKSRRAGAVFDLLASIIAAALEAGCDGRGLNCVPFLTNFFNLSRLGQLITGQNDFLAVPVASCRRPRQRVTVFPILFPPLSRHALSCRPVRNQFDCYLNAPTEGGMFVYNIGKLLESIFDNFSSLRLEKGI